MKRVLASALILLMVSFVALIAQYPASAPVVGGGGGIWPNYWTRSSGTLSPTTSTDNVAIDATVSATNLPLSNMDPAYNTAAHPCDPTGVVDSSGCLQAVITAALAASPKREVSIQQGTYRLTSGLVVAGHNLHITGMGNVILDYRGSGSALSSSLVGGIMPVGFELRNVAVYTNNGGASAIGLDWSFSYSKCYNCTVQSSGSVAQKAVRMIGDASGSGPYYNDFYSPNIQGGSVSASRGISMETSTNVPNTNRFYGGRIGQYDIGVHFEGQGNQLFGTTIEGSVSKVFDFGTGSSNGAFGGYVEGGAGAVVATFGAGAEHSRLEGMRVTSVGSQYTDSSTSQDNVYWPADSASWISSKYWTFNANGNAPKITATQYPGVDWVDSTRALTVRCFNGTAESQSSSYFACQHQGGSFERFIQSGLTSFGFYAAHLVPGVGNVAPTISSGFGTTPSIAGTDAAIRVTVGTGGDTSGVVLFHAAWSTAPVCVAQNETTSQAIRATATTTQVTLTGTMAAADKLTVLCLGY